MMFQFPTDRTYIIAEAGVNHNGDVELARALIDAAVLARADAVKFQLFEPEKLTVKSAPLASYQAQNTNGEEDTQQDMLRKLVLSRETFAELKAYADSRGITFLCTPFDAESAAYLHRQLKLPLLKISSGELTNLPFLEQLAGLNTPLILSTGMASLDEVQQAVETVRRHSTAPLSLLHCTSAYPAPPDAVNLRAIQTLADAFPDCAVGYSDHTQGIHISIAAVAMGARIVEKHFTLDKSLPGPDHKASLSISELTTMVKGIRDLEQALGNGIKQPQPCERDCIAVARRSLVTARDLRAGHILGRDDLTTKRPGTGISPVKLPSVLGRALKTALPEDTLLLPEMLD